MPKIVDHARRREELVAAVTRVIERDGIRAVSVRNVAAESGHSPGALRHYFDSQAGLVAFTMEAMGERAAARIAARRQAPDPDPLDLLCELLPLDPERTAEFQVWLELLTLSRTEPSLAPVAERAHHGIAQVCADAVDRVAPRAADGTRRRWVRELHGLLDGLAMHLAQEFGTLDARAARRSLRDWLDRLRSSADA